MTTTDPSTTLTSASTSTRPPHRKITPISTPITTNPGPLSQSYTHIHSLLQLSLFVLRFPSLVANPVSTLLISLIPVSGLQIIWMLVCLPPHNNNNRPTQQKASLKDVPSEPKGSLPKRRSGGRKDPSIGTLRHNLIPALLSLILTLFTAVPLIFTILILFGAPLTTHIWHTMLCATHIALLAVLPLFYVHGVDRRMWWEISAASLPFDGVWGGSVGAVLGAWLGAVPIPLDWDREWQKWPVTIVTGVYIGWFLGRYAGEYLFRGKRIEFD